jgi:hypothetical protein
MIGMFSTNLLLILLAKAFLSHVAASYYLPYNSQLIFANILTLMVNNCNTALCSQKGFPDL